MQQKNFLIHYIYYNMEPTKFKFDIGKVISQFEPDLEELGHLLFPHVRYPKQAFDRIIKGEANLDSTQIETLAEYLGVLPADLFTIDDWKGKFEQGSLFFIRGQYKVALNYGGSFITVYKDGKQMCQEVKSSVESMTVPEFIQYINNLIN